MAHAVQRAAQRVAPTAPHRLSEIVLSLHGGVRRRLQAPELLLGQAGAGSGNQRTSEASQLGTPGRIKRWRSVSSLRRRPRSVER